MVIPGVEPIEVNRNGDIQAAANRWEHGNNAVGEWVTGSCGLEPLTQHEHSRLEPSRTDGSNARLVELNMQLAEFQVHIIR